MNEIKLSKQQQKIIDFMKSNGGHVTNREIMEKLQINGATARISELRKKRLSHWRPQDNKPGRRSI